MQRPTVIMFENGIPTKAHCILFCSCPVGLSGICCHVLAFLLFLKHYYETGEKMQALPCTEQQVLTQEFYTNDTTEGVKG